MKIWIIILTLSFPVFAQSLSSEDQKRLIEENATLKKENKLLREELTGLKSQNSADTTRMMEVLQKGKKYQEDQLKALEELEQEQ